MIFASDLDRTLIYSKKAFFLAPNEKVDVQLIETLDGKAISYMTKQAIKQLQLLAEQMTFVPVTTRTTEQFKRITVFHADIHHDYAVTSNGANILKNGNLDQDWSSYIKHSLTNNCLSIPEVLKKFSDISHGNWVLKTRKAEEFFIYHIIDPNLIPTDELLQFENWLIEQNWRLSLQGRKLYFVPNVINKADAVKYIQNVTGEETLISAGDSKLDLPLLEVSNHAICPRHGELYKTIDVKKISITNTHGIKASEEILERVQTICTESTVNLS